MKTKILILSFIIGISQLFSQQASITSEYSNIRFSAGSKGLMFWDGVALSTLEIPKNTGKGTIFSAGLWIGGIDANNNLHVAATKYGVIDSLIDYSSGPLIVSGIDQASTDLATVNQYNNLYPANKSQIDYFITNYSNSGYSIPNSILNWPAHGNSSLGYSYNLAPFFDNDNDGVYNPNLGDYPIIKGDYAIYGVMNDNSHPHGETNGRALGVEIRYMIYGFICDSANLDESIFIDYEIINRSDTLYNDVYIGFLSDFDIGGYDDDFIGSNVELNSFYGYNGDDNDAKYGPNPPASGVVFLNNSKIPDTEKQLSRFGYYNNSTSVQGDPTLADEYYNYMSGYWKDARAFKFGGTGYNPNSAAGIECKYLFPGNSDPNNIGTYGIDPAYSLGGGWTEANENNTPGDRRGLGSSGPFTLDAGDTVKLELAIVYGRGTEGAWSSVEKLFKNIQNITAMYNDGTLDQCGIASQVNTIKDSSEDIILYPNPSENIVNINLSGKNESVINYTIFNTDGRIMKAGSKGEKINVSMLNSGIYIINIKTNKASYFKQIVKI